MDSCFKSMTVVCLILLILPNSFLHAQWQENGVPIATATSQEELPNIISDGAGGAIIVWQSYRGYQGSPADIYAQRIDKDGYLLWPGYGVAICTAVECQYISKIIPDGAGGAIIAWHDLRNGKVEIYAQRINAYGNVLWTTDGIAICTAPNSVMGGHELSLHMISCLGGAMLTWHDDRTGEWDVYAQRIDADGTVLWTPNGISVCSESGTQRDPVIVSDGASGAIIAWYDCRNGDCDIYAQRINADSTAQWTPGGAVVCSVVEDQMYPTITSDCQGGAIIAWCDARSDTLLDIYAQRIDGNGQLRWEPDGVAVCTAPRQQFDQDMTSDYRGGAIITWMDERHAVWYEHEIYAQRITAVGTAEWFTDGILIRGYYGWDNYVPRIISDGYGGAIIAWFTFDPLPKCSGHHSSRYEGEDIESIYVQRVAANGNICWHEGGVTLWEYPDNYDVRYPRLTTDGVGGAIVTWSVYYYGPIGIYAQRVSGNGNAPPTQAQGIPQAFYLTQNYPNPFNPSTKIAFGIKEPAHVSLKIYDVSGRLVRVLVDKRFEPGHYDEIWDGRDDGGRTIASGVYFYQLIVGTFIDTKKMILMR